MTEVRSAAAFQRQTEWVTLKSGREVLLRTPDVQGLIMANANKGVIPQPLVDQMVAMLNQDKGGNKKLVYEAADLSGVYEFGVLMTKASVVWPVIVPEGQAPDYEAGQIEMPDLHSSERGEITEWVMRAAGAAGRFPAGQAAGVGTAPIGPAVRKPPKRPVRHK